MIISVNINTTPFARALERLSVKKQNKVIRNVLRNSINVVTQQARRNFKQTGLKFSTKQINKGIRTVVPRGELRGIATAFASRGRNKEYMFRWFEYGTKERILKKRSKTGGKISRGAIKGRDYWSSAYNAKKGQILPRLRKALLNQLKKQYNRR